MVCAGLALPVLLMQELLFSVSGVKPENTLQFLPAGPVCWSCMQVLQLLFRRVIVSIFILSLYIENRVLQPMKFEVFQASGKKEPSIYAGSGHF